MVSKMQDLKRWRNKRQCQQTNKKTKGTYERKERANLQNRLQNHDVMMKSNFKKKLRI